MASKLCRKKPPVALASDSAYRSSIASTSTLKASATPAQVYHDAPSPPSPEQLPFNRHLRRHDSISKQLYALVHRSLRLAGTDFQSEELKALRRRKAIADGDDPTHAGPAPDPALLSWRRSPRHREQASATRLAAAGKYDHGTASNTRGLHTTVTAHASATPDVSPVAKVLPHHRYPTSSPYANKPKSQNSVDSIAPKLRPRKRAYCGTWVIEDEVLAGDFIETRLANAEVVRGIVLPESDDAQAAAKATLAAALTEGNKKRGSPTSVSTITSPGVVVILTSSGHVIPQRLSDVSLHIPRFCIKEDADLLHAARPTAVEVYEVQGPIMLEPDGIGLTTLGQNAGSENFSADGTWSPFAPFEPDSGSSLRRVQARAGLAVILRDFLRETELKYDDMRRGLYALTSNEHWLEARDEVTVFGVAKYLDKNAVNKDGTVLYSTMLAATSLLLENVIYFLPDRSDSRSVGTFRIRSRRMRDDLAQVMNWMEEHRTGKTGPLAAFIDRVTDGLKHCGQTKSKSSIESAPTTWSATDKTIFSVMLDGISFGRLNQGDLYSVPLSHICKSCERMSSRSPRLYRDPSKGGGWDLNIRSHFELHTVIIELMEDLGIYPKGCADWSLADEKARDALQVPLGFALQTKTTAPQVTVARQDTPADLAGVDYDEALREDYHPNVYVIDDASASELDDGISIEPAEGGGGKCWIRAHIADPTSRLLPNDEAAVRAKKQGATLYAPLGFLPMFPDSMPGVASKSSSEGNRALTISALVNAEGMVEEYDVRSTLLRNTHIITYSKVNDILRDPSQAPSQQIASELSLLNEHAQRLYKVRIKNGGFLAGSNYVDVVMPPAEELPSMVVPARETLIDPSLQRLFRGGKVNGDTRRMKPLSQIPLGLSLRCYKIESKPAEMLVASIMGLANRVAAAFIGNQGPTSTGSRLLIPFRGQSFPAAKAESWLKVLDQMKDEWGNIYYRRVMQASILIPQAHESVEPQTHVSLGISGPQDRGKVRGTREEVKTDVAEGWGYTRATSPLRRYADLVVHWQMKALLHRRAARREGVGRKGLDEGAMTALVPKMARQTAVLRSFEKSVRKHWQVKAVRLAWQSAKEAPPPSSSSSSSSSSAAAASPLPPPFPGCISPSSLLLPQAAWVADGEVRWEPTTRLSFVRVQLEELGLMADCHWPIFQLEDRPLVGTQVKVIIADVKEELHGTSIRVRLADEPLEEVRG